MVGDLAVMEHIRIAAAEGEDGGRGVHGDIDAQQDLRVYEGCAAAIDGFDAADVILEEDVFAVHPFIDCAFGQDADAVLVDVGDVGVVRLYHEDGDIDI